MRSLETRNGRVRTNRREVQRRPCWSKASRSTTAETVWLAFLRRQLVSTAASPICQEKRPRHPWPSWWRERVTSLLKAILSWYEGADGQCRHEIFGDIFLLASYIRAVGGHVDFPAHDLIDNIDRLYRRADTREKLVVGGGVFALEDRRQAEQ